MLTLTLLLACASAPDAPPRSTPADPTSLTPSVVSPAEAAAAEARLVDVRPAADHAAGHPTGAVSVPFEGLDPFAPPVSTWATDTPLLVLGEHSRKGSVAAQSLAAAGFDASVVEGGTTAWREAGLPWTE